VALKGYNALRACFRHLGTSMEQEEFFQSSVLKNIYILSFIIYKIFVIFCIFLLINNNVKLKFKEHY